MASNPERPRFSLVVPAHNESTYLPRLLDTVDAARSRYRGGAGAIQVVVADNASTDTTARIARERGCRVVGVERRVIAASRNGGARAALGEVLCFVDADFRIHAETFNAIDDALAGGDVIAGSTGCTLERWSLGIGLTYLMMVPLTWLTGMDTGVVFCRRRDFEAIGGYDENLLYAEDVRFLWDLWRRGRRRGQRLARVRSAKAIASVRKFDEFGDWHWLTGLPRWLFWMFFRRESMNDFARTYWYGDRR